MLSHTQMSPYAQVNKINTSIKNFKVQYICNMHYCSHAVPMINS